MRLDQDWGSQIGNGESWRTLTSAEWQYLFKTRENATKKYGLATVGEAKGLIILPDTFTDPMKNHGYGAFKPNTTSSQWDDNEYTIGGNWEAMEHAGAVFLPVAGYRNGNETYESNIYGYYWSSSAYDESNANIISYGARNFIYGHFNRSYGSSVRLVTNGLFTVTFDLNGGPGGTAPKSIENILRGSLIPRPSNVFVSGKLVVGAVHNTNRIRSQNRTVLFAVH